MDTDEILVVKPKLERSLKITQIPILSSISGTSKGDYFHESKILLSVLYDKIYVKEDSVITFEELNNSLKIKPVSLLLALYALEIEQYISITDRNTSRIVLKLTRFGISRAEFTNKVFS